MLSRLKERDSPISEFVEKKPKRRVADGVLTYSRRQIATNARFASRVGSISASNRPGKYFELANIDDVVQASLQRTSGLMIGWITSRSFARTRSCAVYFMLIARINEWT
jgi:hypothetical protein